MFLYVNKTIIINYENNHYVQPHTFKFYNAQGFLLSVHSFVLYFEVRFCPCKAPDLRADNLTPTCYVSAQSFNSADRGSHKTECSHIHSSHAADTHTLSLVPHIQQKFHNLNVGCVQIKSRNWTLLSQIIVYLPCLYIF